MKILGVCLDLGPENALEECVVKFAHTHESTHVGVGEICNDLWRISAGNASIGESIDISLDQELDESN